MDVFSAPLIIVTTTSLFIQETKDDEQGVGQGIQRAVVSIAAILGPLYAGALLRTIMDNAPIAVNCRSNCYNFNRDCLSIISTENN